MKQLLTLLVVISLVSCSKEGQEIEQHRRLMMVNMQDGSKNALEIASMSLEKDTFRISAVSTFMKINLKTIRNKQDVYIVKESFVYYGKDTFYTTNTKSAVTKYEVEGNTRGYFSFFGKTKSGKQEIFYGDYTYKK